MFLHAYDENNTICIDIWPGMYQWG